MKVKYERRGDYDASRLRDSLVFAVGGKRLALFASHNPGYIGVSADGLCYELAGADLLALFSDLAAIRRLSGQQEGK